MPQGRAAATEQGLRAAQHPTGFDLLDTTLRTLALNLTAAGRELPVIEAVVLHESRVELHLDRDTAPMKPFAAAAGRQDMWTCTASNPDLADGEALRGRFVSIWQVLSSPDRVGTGRNSPVRSRASAG
ncbi:hypothetical protein ACFWOJ_38975, partial [Streptomyces sp. NPDC058439]|uniref:hypothetical protein n=1 Tax=Streptomyces sp. NPDC058439 TaxID=3346500 RepID=UPI003662B493